MYSIYKFTNTLNKKIYVGHTSTTLTARTKSHLKEARRENPPCVFHQAIKKYGIESFTSEIIDTASTLEDIKRLEIHYIRVFDCCILDGPNKGYNMTRGGDGFDSEIVRKNNLERVANGTHPWAGERGSKLNRQTQLRLVAEGRHMWAGEKGSAFATERQHKLNAEGRNTWQGEKGSAFAKANVKRLMSEGRFHSQITHKCPHCGKQGTGNTMKRWHMDNCKKNEGARKSSLVCTTQPV